MRSQKGKTEGEAYLQQYPHLETWLNACVGCRSRGHKPELPRNIYPHFNVAADNLRSFFEALPVDENGLCEQCSFVAAKLAER